MNRMIKSMNGSIFSKAKYINGVGFEILARTPIPQLPPSYTPPTPRSKYLHVVFGFLLFSSWKYGKRLSRFDFRILQTILINHSEADKVSLVLPSESESDFLVTRLMTIIHQKLWYGKLVPTSHQRDKPSHTILCTFSGGNNRIWKDVPISYCLRESWALVNVSSCSEGLESQWVMISTAPNWEDKVNCWNAGSTF